MLEEEISSPDSSLEDSVPQIFPRLPVLSSYQTNWSGIILEHHNQLPFETSEYSIGYHLIGINVGQSFQMERRIDGRWQMGQVFTGAVGLCPVNLSHALRWNDEINVVMLNLKDELLVRNAIELLNTDRVELVWHLAFQDMLIQQIGLALKTELQSNGTSGRLYAESMANALAVHLLRHYSTRQQNIKVFTGGLPQHKLKVVTDYIDDYLTRDLSLEELAAIAQLSSYQFSRTFKQSSGFSPHQYVIQRRVERAKQLLLQGKMSIADIAIACGFTHQSHLNRHFKRLTGVTPKTLLKS
ncbi:MAG: AraC family transcriptional regulator [Cyanobacteriota bacterium]